MKYVVYSKSYVRRDDKAPTGDVLKVCANEADAVSERDKEIGRVVYQRDDSHPDCAP